VPPSARRVNVRPMRPKPLMPTLVVMFVSSSLMLSPVYRPFGREIQGRRSRRGREVSLGGGDVRP
jgi:hypothetical protein